MSAENKPLAAYTPDTGIHAPVEIREYLHPVVENISEVLPQDEIWKLFSSTPGETSGKIAFPYCRIDAEILSARDSVWSIDKYKWTGKKAESTYSMGSEAAFKALVWVEIGFGGLEHLAYSDASTGWTSGIGHIMTNEERAKKILTKGKDMYNECLTTFTKFRMRNKKREDLFTIYNLEQLLEPFT
jgi:hypothetical protein